MNDSWTYPVNLIKKIPPQHYLHVMDSNTGVVKVVIGPKTYLCKDEEKAILGPTPMVVIPPRHYITVKNPALLASDGSLIFDKNGLVKLRWGHEGIRLEQEAFPLYPGEIWDKQMVALQTIPANSALRLQSTRDFFDKYENIQRKASDEWWFKGPGTYIPQVEVVVLQRAAVTIVQPGQALHIMASHEFTDRTGTDRYAGEEWIYDQPGAYLPDINETIVKAMDPIILTDKKALMLESLHQFVDRFGVERLPGDQWLITKKDAETHIPHVFSKVVGEVPIHSLTRRHYVVIANPLHPETCRPQYGKKEIRRGECSFFLQPGESIESTNMVQVITAEMALLVQAKEAFVDHSTGWKHHRKAGEKWLIHGPKEYIPDLEVDVIGKRSGLVVGPYTIFRLDALFFYGVLCFLSFLSLYRLYPVLF